MANSGIELLRSNREMILARAAQHGASNVRVFGSAARGEDRPNSDIDLLVNVESGRSLLDLIGLEQDLEDLLGRRVDLLSDQGISPHIRRQVLADAVPL